MLLFCQTRQMLNLLEAWLGALHRNHHAHANATAAAADAASDSTAVDTADNQAASSSSSSSSSSTTSSSSSSTSARKKAERAAAQKAAAQPYTYVRLDGNTSLGSRQSIVDSFNQDGSVFAALLTTRVGGVSAW